jgi:hypothetical protein
MSCADRAQSWSSNQLNGRTVVTLLWFVIWLIANTIGDREPVTADPLNFWTATLILAVALDLGRQHAPDLGKAREGGRLDEKLTTPGDRP